MKTPSFRLPSRLALGAFSIVLLPLAANADDWIADPATPGLFGGPTNWSANEVPFGTDAVIANGGTAQVGTEDDFLVRQLYIGGHNGTGSLEISGGILTAQFSGGGDPHDMYIGGDNGNGGTGVGSVTISDGILAGLDGEMLFGSRGGTGNLTMTGGTLSNNNWIVFGRDGGGTSTVNLSGNAMVTQLGANHIAVSVFTGTTSTVTMTDQASMTSSNEVRIGWGNNSANTKAVVTMSGESSLMAGSNVIVALREGGGSAAPSGELHMSGNASVIAGNEMWIANNADAHGVLTMTDNAKISVTNGFVVGRFNGVGTATVNGNAEIEIGGVNVIGDGATSVGTLEVNGGFVHSAKQLWLGLNGSDATVTVNGGRVVANAVLDGSDLTDPTGAGVSFSRFGGGGTGRLNLNGGTLETPGFSKYAGSAQIKFNGGTIKVTGLMVNGSFFDGFESSELSIQAGGLRLDTNGNDVTIIQDLTGAGGLVKLGEGTLSLLGQNGYLGDTVVQEGTLSISFGLLADGSNVGLTTGSVFDLNFAGTDTIGALFIDGQAQALGTWGGEGSGADHISSLFSGTGTLTVTAVPEPSTIVLLGLAGMVVLLRSRSPRRATGRARA